MKAALWAEIHRLREREKLTIRAIARRLQCARDTVKKALAHPEAPPPAQAPRGSKLDPHKADIDALIAMTSTLSAVRVLEEIGKKGYAGEISLVRNYLRTIRPARGRVYQEVDYAPGKAMQIDWGSCGTVSVGAIRRKVSVLVAVLCYSRLIYIEFTLSQSKAHFYRCLQRALSFFGGVVEKVIVDNFATAVVPGTYGRNAVFQSEFAEFCGYHRLQPIACDRADPESKGVVEAGVRYIKNNALAGREEELACFEAYRKLAVYWRDKIANVRKHRTTDERPIDRFEQERGILKPLPPISYDTDDVIPTVVTPFAQVRFETNRYSVPPQYARRSVILRADDLWVRVIHGSNEIAKHQRSFERKRRITDPEHQKAAFALRKRSRARQVEIEFIALGTEAEIFRQHLLDASVKPIVHFRRILRLVRLYGKYEVVAALGRAVEHRTFDSAYVVNLVDQERRRRHQPSPLPVNPQRKELLEDYHFDEPEPGDYDTFMEQEGDDR